MYGTWEALDSSELIAFDMGVFLDTCGTHAENFSPNILRFSPASPVQPLIYQNRLGLASQSPILQDRNMQIYARRILKLEYATAAE